MVLTTIEIKSKSKIIIMSHVYIDRIVLSAGSDAPKCKYHIWHLSFHVLFFNYSGMLIESWT